MLTAYTGLGLIHALIHATTVHITLYCGTCFVSRPSLVLVQPAVTHVRMQALGGGRKETFLSFRPPSACVRMWVTAGWTSLVHTPG